MPGYISHGDLHASDAAHQSGVGEFAAAGAGYARGKRRNKWPMQTCGWWWGTRRKTNTARQRRRSEEERRLTRHQVLKVSGRVEENEREKALVRVRARARAQVHLDQQVVPGSEYCRLGEREKVENGEKTVSRAGA